jgi:hypothetical protein
VSAALATEAPAAPRGPGRPDGAATQARRVLAIYTKLIEASPDGAWLDDLAAEFGTTTRTLRRDVDALAAVVAIERLNHRHAGGAYIRLVRVPRPAGRPNLQVVR